MLIIFPHQSLSISENLFAESFAINMPNLKLAYLWACPAENMTLQKVMHHRKAQEKGL
jgi:hypothetical protein